MFPRADSRALTVACHSSSACYNAPQPYDDPQFDDHAWETLNGTAITLDRIPKSGWRGIGWFRLLVKADPALANQPLALVMVHYGASEIYVDGKLVQRFGVVGATPETEVAYNPNTLPINIVLDARGEHVLAVRHSCMELRDLSGGWGKWFARQMTEVRRWYNHALNIPYTMCSIITHPVVPIAISSLFPRQSLTPTIIIAGAICSVIPDLDVISFGYGVKYGEMLGHRGLTHSIFFAAVLAVLLTFLLADHNAKARLQVFIFLLLSTLSHAILDAMTNGGLGVAFFAPFQNERYFFPWRPIQVSPIGVARFFSEWGMRVLRSELQWVWLPSVIIYVIGHSLRRFR